MIQGTPRFQRLDPMIKQLGIDGLVVMYVGNLEPYQGIDLLLQSFALATTEEDRANLVIIGGDAQNLEKYQLKSRKLGIGHKVHFLGPKPLELLPSFLSEADILVSSRTRGSNTPMKVYPYLLSGKPVLATNLPTHTQILDSSVAMLAEPSPVAFSEAMLRLIRDEDARNLLGTAGRKLAEERFSYAAFRGKVNAFLEWLEVEIIRDRNNGHARRVPDTH
jgi:glycosyltransferase involved in cell wall biosynthesis